jgi:uncharacterized membrane protein HdeD (DUF308 family)
MTDDILERLAGNWWTFLLRGIVALVLALFAFLEPQATASGLVYFVAGYFIVSGAVSLFAGLSFNGIGSWWALILLGLAQAFLGVVMLSQPGAGPLAIAYLVAIWAFSTGLMEISSAIALRNYISNEFWWILLGIVTIVLGVYIVMRPDAGLFALVYTIGIYAALAAGSLIGLAFRIKNMPGNVRKAARQAVEGTVR